MTTTRANDTILGYRLEKRIGVGGFGEVWRAEAPGGLFKAIKIVFGYHDDELAMSELKALNRVKELRHPFLLSLERIDIVDGKLIVVTELADGSLKDRFVEHVHQGMHGIPRDELVRYLSDAADGLDFLCQRHLLQHLDVKPDNLLLLGDHVKVADYGLVKDIRDNGSVMSGMTPAYSPPEVFDGRPSQLSDQYSLAVVYQEMLTGIRPYDGSTTSELARQHMLGQPNLDPLPRGDQSVVAKALSKDPTHRYASCTAFIEQLARRRNAGPVRCPREGAEYDLNEPTMVLSGSDLPSKRSEKGAQRMPAIACDGSLAAFHPTIVIGIGGTGRNVLNRIKIRMHQRFGRDDTLSSVHFLAIDSDENSVFQATSEDQSVHFRDEEFLSIPLRESCEYRKTGDRYAKWLSRRWIYNIPRSRSTEGIRPLGRLAFADHSETIMNRLHEIVQTLGNQRDLESSAAATGMPASNVPRVFLVGSIGGGICSGMVSDLAYTVRSILLAHGLSDEQIHAMFLYGSGRNDSESGLAAANAYACLRELYHYAKLGYPGDTSLEIPPFEEGNTAAFSDIYFVHAGAEDYARQQNAIADYLYLDIATASNDFFKRCRSGRSEDGKIRLHTLGLSRFDFHQDPTRSRFAEIVQQHLFSRWLEPNDEIQNFDVAGFVDQLIQSRGLTPDHFRTTGTQVATAVFGEQLENTIRTMILDCVDPENVQCMLRELTETVLTRLNEEAARPTNPALASLGDSLNHPASEMTARLWDEIGALIDNPLLRYNGSLQVHEMIQQRLDTVRAQLRRQRSKIESAIQAMELRPSPALPENDQGATPKRVLNVNDLAKKYAEIARLKCSDALVRKVQNSSAPLQAEFAAIAQLFEVARQHTERLSQSVYTPCPEGPDYGKVIRRLLADHVNLFASMLEKHMDRSYFNSLGGLRRVAKSGAQNGLQLAQAVFSQSQFLVAGSLQGINFDSVLDVAVPANEDLQAIVQRHIKDALPRLTNCGGLLRLMLAVPHATPGARLAKHCASLFDGDPTIVRGTDGDLAVCLEGESVPAEDVALLLLEESPTAVEYIERIGSRLDIEWIRFTGLG